MKALVLGGLGFIGGHVVESLLAAGHSVRILDRASGSNSLPETSADVVYGDFKDKSTLYEAMSDVDVIYHLISTTVPSTSNLDPVEDVKGNLLPTLDLLSCMVDLGIQKIVYLSSGGTVYGIPRSLPIQETHPLRPQCSYGVVKLAIENYLQMFQDLHGVSSVILRAANPYGERQGHLGVQGIVNTFMMRLHEGSSVQIWGDGSVVRDYLYVGDLARLCVVAGEKDVSGVFNAGSGRGVSILDLVRSIEAVSGESLTVDFLPARNFDIPEVILDIAKVQNEMGWSPEFGLEDGLKRTWAWICQEK